MNFQKVLSLQLCRVCGTKKGSDINVKCLKYEMDDGGTEGRGIIIQNK